MSQPDENVLRQYLSGYKHSEATRREVMSVLQQYRSLTFRLEAFIFNNGVRKDLLNLDGTIPVLYKGAYYNIPVCLWLMDTHPVNAPLCFVKPTADMSIKISKYVDNNGKIYLPYLHEWNSNSSSLLGLIHVMITAFSELPPVYSRPRRPDDVVQPPYPLATRMPVPAPAQPTPAPNQMATATTITEEHIRASLLSALEDKLRRRVGEQEQQASAELETLRRTRAELQEGGTRLERTLAALRAERDELERGTATLAERAADLEAGVARLAEHEGVCVDEAVSTTAPLFAQLVEAYAREATLDDAIYYMGEALRKETIDLDTFLKQVRTLARTQFTLRALMQKCRQKARLPL